eukprot:7223958-Prymnesium_polylepis.1
MYSTRPGRAPVARPAGAARGRHGPLPACALVRDVRVLGCEGYGYPCSNKLSGVAHGVGRGAWAWAVAPGSCPLAVA